MNARADRDALKGTRVSEFRSDLLQLSAVFVHPMQACFLVGHINVSQFKGRDSLGGKAINSARPKSRAEVVPVHSLGCCALVLARDWHFCWG